ncbi:hypothetical protein ACP26L_01260 [Paenibacillus sp. S-38]|uniref:hypothetical protein n=1 Tax=Paenibacillus sp. S-38 TaxID=3416710 RepID=UPI003CF1150F
MKNSEDVLAELEKAKSRYRTILQAGISKWVKDFQDGKIKIQSVDDLRKLIEIDIDILKDDFVLTKNQRKRR